MRQIYFLLLMLSVQFSTGQNVTFADNNLKLKLLSATAENDIATDADNTYITIDQNGNGEIELIEAQSVHGLKLEGGGISDLTGLESFSNLSIFEVYDNSLPSLNFGIFPNVMTFFCSNTQTTNINLNGAGNLQHLSISNNPIATLDVAPAINLLSLWCTYTDITTLDVAAPNLQELGISHSIIEQINVSDCPNLHVIVAEFGQLQTLDISQNPLVQHLYLHSNPLVSLYLKNGGNEIIHITQNFNLEYICADEFQVAQIQNQAIDGCEVNSYCTVTPGGDYFVLSGSSHINFDGEDCTPSDPAFPNLIFQITDGTTQFNLCTGTDAGYEIALQSGTYTVTPNPLAPYYTASPASITVDSSNGNLQTQDYCVVPDGEHNDMEVYLFSTGGIPGFDSEYTIHCINRGTVASSGTITFSFPSEYAEYIGSSSTPDVIAPGQLTWNYASFEPLQVQTFTVTLNINAPTDMPPVNSGDQLAFSASVIPTLTDETQSNNLFTYVQTITNSLDPNDMTCLEGNVISPDAIGDYVHYLIRFENTGTAPAQNIVIRDMIDVSKFDIGSIMPVMGSHQFIIRISTNGKAEFIFEGIDLPFDEANNGFVLFKIRTLPSLTTGDFFENTAEIFFDFNFPIVTNTAATTIQTLRNPEYADADFALYPNPSDDVFHITSAMQIDLVQIIDMPGKSIKTFENLANGQSIDVSDLQSGTYFIRISADGKSSIRKLIKI